MDITQVLKRCEVFVGMNDSDLKKLAGLSSWRKIVFNKGEFIFHENAPARDFYILEDGEIRLVVAHHKEGSPEPIQISVDIITKGDVFGWSSLVAPHYLTMSAICLRQSSVLMIDGSELNGLMDINHSLGYEVMKGLVRIIGLRLRDLRGRFVSQEELLLSKYEIHPE